VEKHRAEAAFDASRGNGKWSRDNVDFIAHGVEPGMTASDVDRVMAGTERLGEGLHSDDDPPGHTWSMYRVHYGTPVAGGFLHSPYVLGENFRIPFGGDGRILGVSRVLFGTDEGLSEQRVFFTVPNDAANFGPQVLSSKPKNDWTSVLITYAYLGVGLCVAFWCLGRNGHFRRTCPWYAAIWFYWAVAYLWPIVVLGVLLFKCMDRFGQKKLRGDQLPLPHA
jgi:hypothetical protein